MLNVVAVPVEGVKVIEVGTTLRLTSPRFAGGVSATRTKLTFAVVVPPPPPPVPPPPPPPTVPCLKSWQAESSMAVAKVAKRKDLVCFIEYPTRMNVRSPCCTNRLSRTPSWDFTRNREEQDSGKQRRLLKY